MELCALWNQFFVIIGLLGGLATSFPMDVDSIKEEMKMAAMIGAAKIVDLADEAKAHVISNHKMRVGSFHMEKTSSIDIGKNSDSLESSEEDKKRRRRRSVTEESSAVALRYKRSPCFKKRAQQTTTAAPAAGGGGTAEDGNPDDPARLKRLKRSPDDNDIDDSVIPDQKTLAERTQNFGEKIRQLFKGFVEAMAGVVEKIRNSIRNVSVVSTDDMN